jgi:NAD(P)-dependent dehydrogenase (short-subunit alcohol dehydrogenase family)
VRAATTAFANALAKEVAPFSIQANVVAPNYLYSEMYYPKGRFVDCAEGREFTAPLVTAQQRRVTHDAVRADAAIPALQASPAIPPNWLFDPEILLGLMS